MNIVVNTIKPDAEKFSRFILENYPPSKNWEDPMGYCCWYIGHGFMATCVEGEDKIIALCAMRPVDRPGFGVLPYYFNTEGSCLHIDLLIDPSDDIMPILVFREVFGLRFGPRETVTMFRHTEENIRVYPYKKFWNNLLRIKKAKVKKEQRHESATSTSST